MSKEAGIFMSNTSLCWYLLFYSVDSMNSNG
nr:MAG TPA: hypothetical protein [Caudoviricetes sp.]